MALASNSLSSPDLQAADGEEATGAHQRVAGATQVVAGETLFAPGEPQGLINHLVLGSFPADIDDMTICYVLREGSNATSDVFHFTVEDGGKCSTHLLV